MSDIANAGPAPDTTAALSRKIAFSREVTWASGSIATAAVTNAMSLYALFYLSSSLGIDAALAGTLIFASKLYDAFTDPVMGTISDRFRHPMGRRRPFLGVGAVATGIAFGLFFSLTLFGVNGGNAAIALILLLLLNTAYTVFSVPYLAMPPDIATSYDGRTRLMSIRLFFMMIGVMVGSVGGPLIVEAFQESGAPYAGLGAVLGIMVVVFGLLAFFGTRGLERPPPAAESDAPFCARDIFVTPFVRLAAVLTNAPFAVLTAIKLLQLGVLATALACTPYFFNYVLGRPPADISAYLGTFTLTGILALPALRFVLRKIGKKAAYGWLLGGYSLVMASWYLWQPGEAEVFFYARAVLLGIFSTGALLCALALLPDTMEYDRLTSGRSREGIMSGVFTLVEKVSSAVGPLIIGVLLSSQGLIASTEPGVVQPESALGAVKIGMSLAPALLTLLCIPLLALYRLDEAGLETARRDAAERDRAWQYRMGAPAGKDQW